MDNDFAASVGKTFSRLLDVLEVNQLINDTDREYVIGNLTAEEYVARKKNEKSVNLFADTLFNAVNNAINNKEEEDE